MDINTEFTTINISEKQIIGEFNSNGKDFSRIITPEGFTFIRPTKTIKKSDYGEGRMYFSMPKDFEISLQRSYKVGEDKGKPVYETEEKTVSAEQLKEIYKQKNNEKINDWVVIRVTKNQVLGKFEHTAENGEKVNLSRIITPEGSTFIRQSNQLREVQGNSNLLEFSLKKDQSIRVTKTNFDKKIGENEGKPIYETTQRDVSAEELFDIFQRKGRNKDNDRENSVPEKDTSIDYKAKSKTR